MAGAVAEERRERWGARERAAPHGTIPRVKPSDNYWEGHAGNMSSQPERRSRRAERRLAEQRARRRRQMFLLGGLVAVALIAVIVLIVANRPQTQAGDNLPAVAAGPTPDPAIPLNGRTMGNPSAKVTVTEWGDYQ